MWPLPQMHDLISFQKLNRWNPGAYWQCTELGSKKYKVFHQLSTKDEMHDKAPHISIHLQSVILLKSSPKHWTAMKKRIHRWAEKLLRGKDVDARTLNQPDRTMRSEGQSLIRKGHWYNLPTLQCKFIYKGRRLIRNGEFKIIITS